MHTIRLPYGDDTLTCQVPEQHLMGVFSPKTMPGVEDLEEEVRRALHDPLGTPPLAQLVRPGERIVILVDDHTRATPTARILPVVLDTLHQAGVPQDDVRIVVARGTHRACTEVELQAKVGSEVLRRYQVMQHDCRDDAQMAFVGLTSLGTPVWINRVVVEADRRIGIGHIGPSPYAGYSGAGKLIFPGVASIDSVNFNHSFVPKVFRQIERIQDTVDLVTRRDIDEAASMVGLDLVLDVVMNQADEVVRAFAGAPQAVFQAGLKLARQISEVTVPGLADIALTSGNPYSIDLYQAARAVEYADLATREGGSILLVAPCPDGVGDREFYHLLADHQRPDEFLRAMSRRTMKVTFAVLGYCLARIRAEKRIYVFSANVPAAELQAMGLFPCEDLQQTVDELLAEYGPQARVAVFPNGAVTIPRACDAQPKEV